MLPDNYNPLYHDLTCSQEAEPQQNAKAVLTTEVLVKCNGALEVLQYEGVGGDMGAVLPPGGSYPTVVLEHQVPAVQHIAG